MLRKTRLVYSVSMNILTVLFYLHLQSLGSTSVTQRFENTILVADPDDAELDVPCPLPRRTRSS